MSSPTKQDDKAQSEMAARMYNARAAVYDDSFHPSFAKWMVDEMLQPQPGEHILDLACGTGGAAFPAAEAVGPEGSVTGIDVSECMLMEAEKKFIMLKKLGHGINLHFIKHDIANLGSCTALKGREGSFDALLLISALVLLRDPWHVLRELARVWLKPSGRLIVDAPDHRNHVSGVALERTYIRLGIAHPYNREWMKTGDSLRQLLTDLDFEIEKFVFKTQHGYGEKYWSVQDWPKKWDGLNEAKVVAEELTAPEIVDRARKVFEEEWTKLADTEGKIKEVEGVHACAARAPASGYQQESIFEGSCACGNIKWKSTKPPSEYNFCHCVTCRKVSGGPFLAFVDLPYAAVTIDATPETSYALVKLSKSGVRGFCANCGSSISMRYWAEPHLIGLNMGSIDDAMSARGMQALRNINKKHIFVKDAVSWYPLPDDGVDKQETMNSAERLLIYEDPV